MQQKLLVVCALGSGLVACGISVVGGPADTDAPPAAEEVAPSSPDGSTRPAGAGCDAGACALPDVTPGFALAMFGDAAQACPAGFTAANLVTDPIAGPGACTCGDCSADIDCASGSLAGAYDYGAGKCQTKGESLDANHGVCRDETRSLVWAKNGTISPPTAVVGACSAAAVVTPSAVTTTAKRLCIPDASTCAAAACAPPPGLSVCMVQDGDGSCPPHAPNKHLVGADVALTCEACPCTMQATCTGKLETFEQANCGGAPVTVLANQCMPTDDARLTSYRWTGTVDTQTCAKDPASPPAVALVNARTVCCP